MKNENVKNNNAVPIYVGFTVFINSTKWKFCLIYKFYVTRGFSEILVGIKNPLYKVEEF